MKMTFPIGAHRWWWWVAMVLVWSGAARGRAAESKLAPGLIATFAAGDRRDVTVATQVAWHVGAGEACAPFVPAGAFTTTWEGWLNAELRSTFQFRAELNGALRVEINGVPALDARSAGGASALSEPVRLNKGTNAFKAVFTSPAEGEAFVRLAWTEKGTNTSPVPPGAFTHGPTREQGRGGELRLGRELFLEHRCIRCHRDDQLAATGVPELRMDAPSFAGIGARRNGAWMARWILDPKAMRASATMPKLLHGLDAPTEAKAIAVYLGSLRSGGEVELPNTAYQTRPAASGAGEEVPSDTERKPLYERLHCAGCHDPPDSKDADPTKLSHRDLAAKFPRGRLAEFLRAPEAHYAWTRMPNFHLSAAEARELEDHLLGKGESAGTSATTDATLRERGRKLVQTRGCLNCHGGVEGVSELERKPLTPLFARKVMPRIAAVEGDCLAARPFADYRFTLPERAALGAFLDAGRESLSHPVPAEFATRQMRLLRCDGCHGPIEFVPPLDPLGEKLKPEWLAKFLAGDIPHKLRYDQHPRGEPWMEARMPSFRSRAADLAAGLAALHGFGPRTPAEPPVDAELARLGQKLTGKDGGFSCVSCHAVGPVPAMEVFDSEGLNLAWSAERLQPAYFRRWMRNPPAMDPQTKMPAYFDEEGRSSLTEILEGDAERQISAVWHYLRLGEKMPVPRNGTD